MNWIVIFGIISGAVNAVIHYNNDAAFWGWLVASAWATALLFSEIAHRYDKY